MNRHAIKLTEFPAILSLVAEQALSRPAKERILAAGPVSDFAAVERALLLTREAELIENKYRAYPLTAPFPAVDEICVKAGRGAMLSFLELLKVAALLKTARILKNTVLSCGDDIVLLKREAEALDVCRDLEDRIGEAIVSENEMSDNAGAALKEIRRRIAAVSQRLKDRLSAYTKSNEWSSCLQDNIVTIRNGRYVLPVKSECRGRVKGLLHDMSASGSTAFIEPLAVVELNNELREAQNLETAEIERILYAFGALVSSAEQAIIQCQECCIMSDIVFSKWHYSRKIDGIFPKINLDLRLRLENARHPLIASEKVVPVTIEVGGGKRILLISGPNTGGKTVCLKSAGLFCLMAYFGLFLPCSAADVAVFDDVFCDMGDEQSIENELSTFSSHILNINAITGELSKRSLVLLDEPGGGTDPEEGAALAAGIVKFVEDSGAAAIITTHYGELKEYALLSPSIRNACMQFDEATLSPTYKLIPDMPGTSNALKTARRLKVEPAILKTAYARLSGEKRRFDALLENAEALKNRAIAELAALADERRKIESERERVEKKAGEVDALYARIRNNAAAETKRLVQSALGAAEAIIEEMKAALLKADEAALLEAKHLKKRLDDIEYTLNREDVPVEYEDLPESELVPGAVVIVKSLFQTGVVKEVRADKREAAVSIGSILTKARFDDLARVRQRPTPAPQKGRAAPGANVRRERGGDPAPTRLTVEVKVLGLTVAEALEVVEPHLLRLSADGGGTLKIVHGKGTGALGRGIQAYLKTNPLAGAYRYGRYGEGDTGVTLVEVG
ncbi:MAG: Smr/MutS family protein [Clostridiales bacterium]|jgi:DNA mismatch repair protein MutS2|nr:Smr/MutS family protein [Clostridiales bacterium]